MKILAAAFAAALAAGCASTPSNPPDVVLYNGKIVTVDPKFSIAQAVAIRNDRFVAVGTNDAVRSTAGTTTRQLDLRGRTVIPGLMDGHLHNAGGGPGVDLSRVRTIDELFAAVAARVKSAAPGGSSSRTATGTKRSCTRSACRTLRSSTASRRKIPSCSCAAATNTSSTQRPRSAGTSRARRPILRAARSAASPTAG